jgi:two-component system cell cycle response regulator
MIDIDHFKQVNDRHGHAAGDYVLKEVVNRMTLGLRPSDLVARLGGEEFAIIMPETEPTAAFNIADRLRKRVDETPIEGADRAPPFHVSVSIGVAASPANVDETMQDLFRRSDAALYQAKNNGRNCVMLENGKTANG